MDAQTAQTGPGEAPAPAGGAPAPTFDRRAPAFDAPAQTGPGVLGLLSAPLTDELVRKTLRAVIDPELGVNIVDLGLVYDIRIHDGGDVRIEMTLTTPGCPLGGYIEDEINAWLAQLPQVRGVCVQIVWEPPWDPSAMSNEAREQLGWLL